MDVRHGLLELAEGRLYVLICTKVLLNILLYCGVSAYWLMVLVESWPETHNEGCMGNAARVDLDLLR